MENIESLLSWHKEWVEPWSPIDPGLFFFLSEYTADYQEPNILFTTRFVNVHY